MSLNNWSLLPSHSRKLNVSLRFPFSGMRVLSPMWMLLSSPHNRRSPNRYSVNDNPSRTLKNRLSDSRRPEQLSLSSQQHIVGRPGLTVEMKVGPIVSTRHFFTTSMNSQIPVIVEKSFSTCGCKKFQLDVLGDHLSSVLFGLKIFFFVVTNFFSRVNYGIFKTTRPHGEHL